MRGTPPKTDVVPDGPKGASEGGRHGLVLTALVVGLTALAGFGLASWSAAYGGQGVERVREAGLYRRYALEMLGGRIPYRDFEVEYPPLALPLLAAPAIVASSEDAYYRAFAAEMLAWQLATFGLIGLWLARTGRGDSTLGRVGWAAAAWLLLCPLALCRFDGAVACLAMAAAVSWDLGRTGSGGVLAGLGVLVKLVPGLVAVPAAVELVERRDRKTLMGFGGLIATVAFGLLAWRGLGGSNWAGALRYHGERGLEVGSTWSGLLLLLAAWEGKEVPVAFLHASTELVGIGAGALARLAVPAQLVGLGAMALAEGFGRDRMRTILGVLLAYVAFGKVLSPQYLIWILPFAAVIGGKSGAVIRLLLILACGLTTLLYPWAADRLPSGDLAAALVLNGRNVLLIVAWGLTLSGRTRTGWRGEAERPSYP